MEDELSLYDVLVNHGDFDKLLQAIDASEAVRAMFTEEDGPFTLFAPTDDAFSALEVVLATKEMSLMSILADEELLGKILSHHVAEGLLESGDVMTMNGQSATFQDGQMAKIKVDGESVMIGEANVLETDLEGFNGIVHAIDMVMLPEGLDL